MDYSQAQAQASSGYIGGGSINAAPEQPLSDKLDIQYKRLTDIYMRLDGIADMLHGPSPKQAGILGADTPRPMPSMASRVRDLTELVSRIDAATARIVAGL